MTTSINCINNVESSNVDRIDSLSRKIVQFYEEIIGLHYGRIPDIVLTDRQGCADEMYNRIKNLKREDLPVACSDDLWNILCTADRNDYWLCSKAENDTPFYTNFAHLITIPHERLGDDSIPLVLSHELMHGHSLNIAKRKFDNDINDAINEGIANYMSFLAVEYLGENELITREEYVYAMMEKHQADTRYPTSADDINPANIIYKHLIGNKFVEHKMENGLPIKNIFSLYDNLPQSLRKMYIPNN